MKQNCIFLKNIFINFGVYLYAFLWLFLFAFWPSLFLKNSNTKIVAMATSEQKVTYAKALKNCSLYKDQSLSDNPSNIYFFIPESYFVTIVSKINESVYKVLYDKFTGYCKSDDLTVANFTPTVISLTGISFDIKQNAGTQIWSAPSDQNSQILSTISADTKAIEYIANIVGEIPIGGSSNIWYYARYTPASYSTAVYEGYVYSEATTNLTHIPVNLETNNEPVAEPLPKSVNLNTSLKVVFIILICMPFAILFLISLVKAKKQFVKTSEPTTTAVKQTAELPPPKRKINGSFVKKPKKPTREIAEDTIEVVFPEYNFVDDDDLL